MEDIEIIDERDRYNPLRSDNYYDYSFYRKKYAVHEGTLLYDYVSKWIKKGKDVRLVRSIVFDDKEYLSFTAGKVMYTFEEDKIFVGKCKFVYTILTYDYGGEEWRPVINIPDHPRYKFTFTWEGSNSRWMIYDVITLSRISATSCNEYNNLNVSKEDEGGWMDLTYMKGKKRVFKFGKICIDDSNLYTYKYNGILIKADLNTMEILERKSKRISPDRMTVSHIFFDEEWQDIIRYAYKVGDDSFCVNDVVASSVLLKQKDPNHVNEILSLMVECGLLINTNSRERWIITERGKYNISQLNLYKFKITKEEREH